MFKSTQNQVPNVTKCLGLAKMLNMEKLKAQSCFIFKIYLFSLCMYECLNVRTYVPMCTKCEQHPNRPEEHIRHHWN